MALFHCNFFSEILGVSTSMDVVLPQQTVSQIGMKECQKKQAPDALFIARIVGRSYDLAEADFH